MKPEVQDDRGRADRDGGDEHATPERRELAENRRALGAAVAAAVEAAVVVTSTCLRAAMDIVEAPPGQSGRRSDPTRGLASTAPLADQALNLCARLRQRIGDLGL